MLWKFNDIIKKEDEIAKFKVKCKNCGHIVVLVNAKKTICSHCGVWVFKNDKIEFEYRLKERMNK
jgi:ribosomal protein L37E